MVVLEHQHAEAAVDRQQLAGNRDAVADRRDQRDIRGIGADQGSRRLAGALVLLVGELRGKLPRLALAGDSLARRLLRGARQRAPARRVQVGDFRGDIEEGAL